MIGVIMFLFVNGWIEDFDVYLVYDVVIVKVLMEEVGYGDGFSLILNCLNDCYINDEVIC